MRLKFCIARCLVIASIVFSASNAPADSIGATPPLRWTDPFLRRPLTYEACRIQKPSEEIGRLELRYETPAEVSNSGSRPERLPLIAVFINERLVASIEAAMDQFIIDIEADGYEVALTTLQNISAAELRATLQDIQPQGLVGTILIGDCPVAWYELDDAWNYEHEEFPMELYFMDLDGSFSDQDGDGLLDGHSGDVAPEIWAGRIDAHRFLMANETELLQNYFFKNHAYRNGSLSVQKRGLEYIDDDWAGYGYGGLDAIYSNVTRVEGENQTIAFDYQSRLLAGYEFVHLMAHSCPWAHTFRTTSGYGGSFFNYDLEMTEPKAFFYNLFSCSNTRFVEYDCIGGYYIFQEQYGLAAIGSAKTGSMLEFQDFYGPLGTGESFGEAYLSWWQAQASGGYSSDERSWYYGLAILGDPTLHVNLPGNGDIHDERASEKLRMAPDRTDRFGVSISSSPYSDGSPVICSALAGACMSAWMSATEGRSSITTNYYNGSAWAQQTLIEAYEYWEIDPCLLTRSNGEIWAFFSRFDEAEYDYNVYASRWQGSNWSAVHAIDDHTGYDLRPSAAEREGAMHLVYQSWRDGDANIYWTCSSNGSSWSNPQRITAFESDDCDPFIMTENDGALRLFWVAQERGLRDIASMKYDGLWSSAQYVSPGSADCDNPSAASDGSGGVWLSFTMHSESDADIAAMHFDGDVWSALEPVAVSNEDEVDSSIIAWEGRPAIVYHTRTSDHVLNMAIRESRGWETTEIENSFGHDLQADWTTDGTSDPWMAWTTNREGDSDVYAVQMAPGASTETPVATNTPIPSWTQGPTISPTPTPDRTFTQSPTATPSSGIQTPTATPMPSGTPTRAPSTNEFKIQIYTNQESYQPADSFVLSSYVDNSGPAANLDQYIVLDVAGSYWFWPTWSISVDCRKTDFENGYDRTEIILDFIWPDTEGPGGAVVFWSACLNPSTQTLYGNVASCSFTF